MIFFGHLGLTAGAVKALEAATTAPVKPASQAKARRRKLPDIDYRLVLLGSILPDLFDKPIGALLFINTYHNSRIYAHTLLFSLALLLWGALLYRKRKSISVLTLGICSIIHLTLDSMWLYPETLFWPFWNIRAALAAASGGLRVLLGFPYRFEDWLAGDIQSILRDPTPLVYEAAGVILLTIFFIRLLRRKQLKNFIKTGKLL